MKKINAFSIILLLSLFYQSSFGQSCFTELSDISGYDTSPFTGELQTAASEVVDVFPLELQDSFQVLDFGFYLHTEDYQEGIASIWEAAKQEADQVSPYYLIFGKQSDESGTYTKLIVDFKLPEVDSFECFDEEKQIILKDQLGAIVERYSGMASEYVDLEKQTMSYFSWAINQIVNCGCHALKSGNGCDLCVPEDFLWQYLGVRYWNPGETIQKGTKYIGRTVKSVSFNNDFDSSVNGIVDSLGATFTFGFTPVDGNTQVEFDLNEPINLVAELAESKAVFDTIGAWKGEPGLNGRVFIVNGAKFCNIEPWINAAVVSVYDTQLDYVEVHILANEGSNNYGLYSRYFVKEQEEKVIWREVFKFAANSTIDILLQMILYRLIDEEVCGWGDAWNKVNISSAVWSGLSSLLPWKKEQDFLGAVAENVVEGIAVVVTNALHEDNYTVNQGMIDFTVIVGSGLVLWKANDYITKHGNYFRQIIINNLDHWFESISNAAIKGVVKKVSWLLFKQLKGLDNDDLKDAYFVLFSRHQIRGSIEHLSSLASDLASNPNLKDFLEGDLKMIRAWELLYGNGDAVLQTFRSNIENIKVVEEYLDAYPDRFSQIQSNYLQVSNKQNYIDELLGPAPYGSRDVNHRVKGLYEGIDPDDNLEGVLEDLIIDANTILTRVKVESGGDKGHFIRAYDSSNDMFIFDEGFIKDAPTWLNNNATPYVTDEGIPTQMLVTLRQMKLLGVPDGSLKTLKMSIIQNKQTILWLCKVLNENNWTHYSQVGDLILTAQGKIISYATSTIKQAGYRVKGGSLTSSPDIQETTIGVLADLGFFGITHEDIIANGLKPDYTAFYNFNIIIDLETF